MSSVRVGKQGRVVLPAKQRRELGLSEGDELLSRIQDGRLIFESRELLVRELQEQVGSHVPDGVSLAEELIKERRREARRDAEKLNGSA